MKRGTQYANQTQSAAGAKPHGGGTSTEMEIDAAQLPRNAREEVRARQPQGAFDARAFRELSQAVPIDPRSLRRTIRRNELRQIVPLADSTIYELERRGEFPQRFFLTPRCVVWDLAEVEAWLRSRRQPEAGKEVKKAPVPDYKLRKSEK
jgi:prophage regulatory protein